MDIQHVEFVKSSTDVEGCPQSNMPEYAFTGRSNVGKSSLINMLAGRGGVAHTSNSPGRTQLINHFSVNGQWHLVDLPGYGYAKVSKKERAKWKKMVYSYILNRANMANLFLLIDARHSPQELDLEFITFLGGNAVPFSLVFTKTDKISVNQLRQNLDTYTRKLRENWDELPPVFTTSAIKKSGRAKLLDYIGEINKNYTGKA
jgi:GTP-binding protein